MNRFFIAFWLVFSSTLTISSGAAAASDSTIYWMRFKADTREERTAIANLGVSIESVIEDSVIALGRGDELEAAKRLGNLEVFFALDHKMMDFPKYDELFHNYDEIMASATELAEDHPGLVRLYSMGNSVEGRPIPIIVISTAQDDRALPAVFFMGGHHAREHVSVEVPLMLAHYLADSYGHDDRITELLDNRTVYIAPTINPDGKEYDIHTGNYLLWRKNRAPNGGSSHGVDLNRNYGGPGYGGEGSSSNPDSDIYHGPDAFSEPETRAVRDFFESHPNITINLSFHTFSQLILYPWGSSYDPIPDQYDYSVHRTMAEAMAEWNGYAPQQSSDLYIASGDTSDWAYGVMGRISFTFELDPAGSLFDPSGGFYPGQEHIEPTFIKNLEPCLYLIEYADNPYRVLEPEWKSYGLNSPIL